MSESDPIAEAMRWRRFAEEDLQVAKEMAAGEMGTPRHACLLAQQAAEKMLKSVLVQFQIYAPKTHDLDRLRTLLPEHAQRLIDWIDLAELSQWAVESRYPGDWPEATEPDANRAVSTPNEVCTRLAQLVSEDR